MSFTVDSKYNMKLTRGDSAYFDVAMIDEHGDSYEMQTGDRIWFSVKKNADDPKSLIKIEGGSDGSFRIAPGDTAKMTYGKYVYDVQLNVAASDDVFTVIDIREFELTKEVTW